MVSKAKKPRSLGEKDPETVEQGKRLKLARERAGYEYAQDGAKVVGEKVNTYRQYENGTRPYWEYAKAFGEAFHVSPAWLLWGTDVDPIFELAEALAGVEDKQLAVDVMKGALAPLLRRA